MLALTCVMLLYSAASLSEVGALFGVVNGGDVDAAASP